MLYSNGSNSCLYQLDLRLTRKTNQWHQLGYMLYPSQRDCTSRQHGLLGYYELTWKTNWPWALDGLSLTGLVLLSRSLLCGDLIWTVSYPVPIWWMCIWSSTIWVDEKTEYGLEMIWLFVWKGSEKYLKIINGLKLAKYLKLSRSSLKICYTLNAHA